MILKSLRTSVVLLLILTLITGLFYPLLITAIAQLVFPAQANGSLILEGGRVVGSAFIGQPFTDPRYFWSRPSATASFPYNAGASSGSNLGPAHRVRLGMTPAMRPARFADNSSNPGNHDSDSMEKDAWKP